jgi:hypothetical protein
LAELRKAYASVYASENRVDVSNHFAGEDLELGHHRALVSAFDSRRATPSQLGCPEARHHGEFERIDF